MNRNQIINQEIEQQPAVLQTMTSGLRSDALHWQGVPASLFSTEKLQSILQLAELTDLEMDQVQLEKIRQELCLRGYF